MEAATVAGALLMSRRGYKGILTDREVLRVVKSGLYKVDTETGVVTGPKGHVVKPFADRKTGFLFVRVYCNGKRKAIAVSRLVWMAWSGRTIPKGFEIHHGDGDNNNNCWRNLFCLFRKDHEKVHYNDDPIPF